MRPQLNHLIVWARNRHESAAFLSDILGLGSPTEYGHFTQVETGSGVAIDFGDTDDEPLGMHLAFLVTEREFDQAFARIIDQGVPHSAGPSGSQPGRINHNDGGRGRLLQRPEHQCRVGDHHPPLRFPSNHRPRLTDAAGRTPELD